MSYVEEMNNYLFHHQQLMFEIKTTNDIDKIVDKRRSSLVHTFSASTQLTNGNSLDILRSNLVSDASLYDNSYDELECKISNLIISNENIECHSKLHETIIDPVVEPLQCSQSNMRCSSTNMGNYHDFNEFSQYFDITTNINAEYSKIRKIAKSFLPQSCNSQDIRNIKLPVLTTEQCNTFKRSHCSTFKTAFDELQEQKKKIGSNGGAQKNNLLSGQKRKLGTRRNVQNKFVSPMLSNSRSEEFSPKDGNSEWPIEEFIDDRLKNIEPRMVELIRSEIMDTGAPVHWDDIAGLEFAKNAIQEAVVWPFLRPDIFTGLRRPPKGILLFGPPGTGKTLIGKCVASQSKSTFFSISASSLTSKWIGDGEKMVRALFCVARVHQPSVIFIDEIDSLLSQRSHSEHESSRRIKTEFLVQLDGATTDNEERILVIGATNRPQELDEAARRRFVKRLYIPLPEYQARIELVARLMERENHNLSKENVNEISRLSDGYSGADMKNLCSEASLGPIRCIGLSMILCIQPTEVRPINMDDFVKAFTRVRSSVSPKDLHQYMVWNETYGSGI